MPPKPLKAATIAFPGRTARLVILPPETTDAARIVEALQLPAFRSVILVIGGAEVSPALRTPLIQLFNRGILRTALRASALLMDGGTDAGIMSLMGQAVADHGYHTSLLGVAPGEIVSYPGGPDTGTPLEPNHSHFVLTQGHEWGSETHTLFRLRSFLTRRAPGVVVLVSGGTITRLEMLEAVRQKLRVIVIEGSGGFADAVAAAFSRRATDIPEDPALAEIIEDGDLHFHLLGTPLTDLEHAILRALETDKVLIHAWSSFADYDLNATIHQRQSDLLQLTLIGLGVLITFLAVLQKVVYPGPPGQAAPQNPDFQPVLYYCLLILPIVVTVITSASNRFKHTDKWILMRAAAESIKREIYWYRVRAGGYRQNAPLLLAQKIEEITSRTMATIVNADVMAPYDPNKSFPPDMDGAEGADDGMRILSPDKYIEVRLGDQLNYFRKKTRRLDAQQKVLYWSIYLIGGIGTLLAAINEAVWIALTTSVATALTGFLAYRQVENTLIKYNQTFTNLDNIRGWWDALIPVERLDAANVDLLVSHTEQVLQSELDGWVQQMQNALAGLQKAQGAAPQGDRDGEQPES